MSILDEMVSKSPEESQKTDNGPSDFEAVRKKIFGSGNKSSKRKSSPAESETSQVEKDLEKLFSGENWEQVASLYFDSRFAITGWEGFLLTDPQKKTLGVSLSTTMKMLLKIDPGYIAMVIFLANFGGLIATKEVTYRQIIKEMERRGATPPAS